MTTGTPITRREMREGTGKGQTRRRAGAGEKVDEGDKDEDEDGQGDNGQRGVRLLRVSFILHVPTLFHWPHDDSGVVCIPHAAPFPLFHITK